MHGFLHAIGIWYFVKVGPGFGDRINLRANGQTTFDSLSILAYTYVCIVFGRHWVCIFIRVSM